MAKYVTYRYIYPPRPKNAIPDTELDFWDNGSLIAQPKLNGSNCLIFTNGHKFYAMNRHAQRLTNFQLSESEINSIYRGQGWMILNGEYMNKSKSDESGNVFNHKFVIFDILCFNGEYLVGKTFQERLDLLDILYLENESDKDYLLKITENVFRVKSYDTGFKSIFDQLIKIDMVEGIVMKRKSSRLEIGTTENNNVKSQLKCRKSTKLYKY